MSTAQGNIFLTTENLAFSLPLIAVCGSYAYFKYVPLEYGVPILGAIVVVYQIRSQMRIKRENKIQNMDEKAINDLALELEGEEESATDTKKKKLQLKKKAKVEQRLAAERKNNAKNKNSNAADDEDDDVYLETFAKGTKKTKKN